MHCPHLMTAETQLLLYVVFSPSPGDDTSLLSFGLTSNMQKESTKPPVLGRPCPTESFSAGAARSKNRISHRVGARSRRHARQAGRQARAPGTRAASRGQRFVGKMCPLPGPKRWTESIGIGKGHGGNGPFYFCILHTSFMGYIYIYSILYIYIYQTKLRENVHLLDQTK